jgi:hypothetical protein
MLSVGNKSAIEAELGRTNRVTANKAIIAEKKSSPE